MTDPLEWMAEIDKKHHFNHGRTVYASEWQTLREILKAQRDEMAQKDARIARLECGLESAKRDLRRAAMSGPDTGHYPAFHEVCELLAEHPRQSAAALKAEREREKACLLEGLHDFVPSGVQMGDESVLDWLALEADRFRANADRIEREAKEQGDE